MRGGGEPILCRLLPPGVHAAEGVPSDEEACPSPEEANALGKVSIKRFREFAAARKCARLALQRLGVGPQPILIGPQREPVWPAGLVGSITHCAGYCAAVVARRGVIATIGIDAEVHAALPAEALGEVLRPEERELFACNDGSGIHWDRVLFSAKESVYKAWFPLTRRWLGFQDAVVTFDRGQGTFIARLRVPLPQGDGRAIDCFRGTYLVHDGLVFTAAWL